MLGNVVERLAATCAGTKVEGQEFCTGLPVPAASSANFNTIIQVVVGVLAVVAVLIIVMAALNIVTAGGDAGKVAKARSAIIYSLIGLAIIVIADAIVLLVIGKI